MEPQLIASGRLVSLGEITASMAHEFNNQLGIIIGFAQDLLSEHPGGTIFYYLLALATKTADIENAPVGFLKTANNDTANR